MRATISCFLLAAMALLLSGCISSTLCLESKKQLHPFHDTQRPVYVINPQMQPEYGILKASRIYSLTNQPDGARLLTLHSIGHRSRCGNPLLLTLFTFGFVPGYLPGGRSFGYDLNTDGTVVTYIHSLPLYERYSAWEWLIWRSDKKAMAEGLTWSTREQWQPNTIY